jgi:hypothetical protein
MKMPSAHQVSSLLAGLAATCCFAAPEFIGVLISQGTTYVAVRSDATKGAIWLNIGDRVDEYRVAAYDPKRAALLLKRDGTDLELFLKSGAVQSAPTVELLEQLVKKGDSGRERELQELRVLDARCKKTAAELADLESRATADPRAAEKVPHLRRQLQLEQGNLAYYLESLTAAARSEVRKVP